MSKSNPAALVRLPPDGSAPLVISCKPSDDPARDVERAKAIACGLAPRSVERLAELMENSDAKIALAAIAAIRQWSGPSRTAAEQAPEDLEVSDETLDAILKPGASV